jgi:16S rRNA (guanine527-N7)-methyltransferase
VTASVGEELTRDYVSALGVSRETQDRLTRFAVLLRNWTKRLNLIAPSTVPDLWTRHILDSAQVFPLAPAGAGYWLDLGTGGGLPGLVCAILARDLSPDTRFGFVESDRRKCAFIATCIRDLRLDATVYPHRVEDTSAPQVHVVSARGLAPLARLFALAEPLASADTTLLFPKGARHDLEIVEAEATWRFTVTAHPSITSHDARILECHLLGRI